MERAPDRGQHVGKEGHPYDDRPRSVHRQGSPAYHRGLPSIPEVI